MSSFKPLLQTTTDPAPDESPSTESMSRDDPYYNDEDDGCNGDLETDPLIDSTCPGCLNVSPLATLASIVCFPFSILLCCGLQVVPERRHAAILVFGKYRGSVQSPGIHCLPPCFAEWRYISTATRTMNMKDLKVLDRRGNPVVISAVVTFVPTSAKKARVEVQEPWPNASEDTWGFPTASSGSANRESRLVRALSKESASSSRTFLQLQAQAVLKQVASMFPYEAPAGEPSLQTEGAHLSEMLIQKLQQRVNIAGAKILSFDLVDLSYAPEIASAMLVRQQASALVDARKLIVQAAVDMTTQAVTNLEANTGKELSAEARDRTCTNLLTVICSNEAVTPTLPMAGGSSSSGSRS